MPIMIQNSKSKLMCSGSKITKMYCQGDVIYSSGNIVTYMVDGAVYQQVELDEGSNVLTAVPAPSKSMYTFLGWSEENGGNVLSNFIMGDDPIILYAVLLPNNLSSALTAEYLYGVTSNALTNVPVYNWYSNAYDLTYVKTIKITFNYYYYSKARFEDEKYYYNTFDYYAGISNNKSGFQAQNGVANVGKGSNAYSSNGSITVVIDVSSFNGNYYIGCSARGKNSYDGGPLGDEELKSGKHPRYYTTITSVIFS